MSVEMVGIGYSFTAKESARYRPKVPEHIQQLVALKQCEAIGVVVDSYPGTTRKRAALLVLFGDQAVQLDHDPALILRPYDKRTRKYLPDANNPEYLRWRATAPEAEGSHFIKTYVRGAHGARSDIGERNHRRRMDENRGLRKRKPKAKIAARVNPWPPKGSRKLGQKHWRGTEWRGKR